MRPAAPGPSSRTGGTVDLYRQMWQAQVSADLGSSGDHRLDQHPGARAELAGQLVVGAPDVHLGAQVELHRAGVGPVHQTGNVSLQHLRAAKAGGGAGVLVPTVPPCWT